MYCHGCMVMSRACFLDMRILRFSAYTALVVHVSDLLRRNGASHVRAKKRVLRIGIEVLKEITDHPMLGVAELAFRIRCVLVVPPCPSYTPVASRQVYKPRKVLPYEASKDAWVDAWRLDLILILERPADEDPSRVVLKKTGCIRSSGASSSTCCSSTTCSSTCCSSGG